MTHTEWLNERRTGIGGSDAAVIMGSSPWKSRYGLWAEKRGLLPPQEDNEILEFGRRIESVVRDAFRERHPEFIVTEGDTSVRRSPDYPFMLATLDGELLDPISEEPIGIFEAKTSAVRSDWDEKPPLHYQCQVQHYMACTGLTEAWIAVLINGNSYKEFSIKRNDRFISILIAEEAAFWEMVQSGNAPPRDSHPDTKDSLSKVYSDSSKESVVIDNLPELYARRMELKEVIGEKEKELSELENEIRFQIGSAEIALDSEGKKWATWAQAHKTSFDSKRFKEDNPDLYERYVSEQTYRVLRWREAK